MMEQLTTIILEALKTGREIAPWGLIGFFGYKILQVVLPSLTVVVLGLQVVKLVRFWVSRYLISCEREYQAHTLEKARNQLSADQPLPDWMEDATRAILQWHTTS